MKTIVQLVIAGMIGGAVAFGAFKAFDKDTVIYEQIPAKRYDTSSSTTVNFHDDFVGAAEKANPAVVHIAAENEEYRNYTGERQRGYDPFEDFWGLRRNRGERPKAGTGSGVILTEDGYIVTNNHVVGFADYLSVTMHDGVEYQAKKIGTDPSTDLAVIKVEGTNFPYLSVGNSDDVKIGQWVVAAGNPFNLRSTVTAGIVSAKGRDLNIIRDNKGIEEFIQTDAVVNPGNSGGALVNLEGELIGINTAISSPTGFYAGYSFAIPSNLVDRVVNEIMETGGDIQRAMLGIMIADVPDVIEIGVKVGRKDGVYITDYATNPYGQKIGVGSAEYAGVKKGDVIIGVNNKTIQNSDDLHEALKFVKVGDTVDVRVYRKGREKTIPVKLRQGI